MTPVKVLSHRKQRRLGIFVCGNDYVPIRGEGQALYENLSMEQTNLRLTDWFQCG